MDNHEELRSINDKWYRGEKLTLEELLKLRDEKNTELEKHGIIFEQIYK